MRQLFKSSMIVLIGAILLAGFGYVLCGIFALSLAAGVSLAQVGAVTNSTVDTETVKAGSPELDDNYISQAIVEMLPARTPLDTLMRKAKREKINSFVYEFYKVDTKAVADTVKTGYTAEGDGAEAAAIVANNPDIWSVDDTILVPELVGRDGKELVLYINAINRATGALTVQALNGADGANTTANKRLVPNIIAGTKLYRMGKAGSELDAQTTPYAMLPIKDNNNCQIFMAQVQESTYQKLHKKEANWGFSDYERMNVYDMKQTMEASYLWGYKHYFKDIQDSDMKYTTGGVWRNVTKRLGYGAGGDDRAVTRKQYVGWTKSIFTGNNGSDKRIFWYGGTLGASLHEVDSWQRFVEGGKTEVVHGITFNQIVTNFGILLAAYHPLFDLYGYEDYGLVVDINHLVKFAFKDLEEIDLDLIGSGQKNANAKFITEASGIATRYPDCHAIIAPNVEGAS